MLANKQCIIFVTLYFAYLLTVSWYNKGKGNAERLPRNNSIPLLTAAIFLSSVGGGTIIGIAEKATMGKFEYPCGLLYAVLADIAVGLFVSSKIANKKAFSSAGELIEYFYGTRAKTYVGICATLFAIGQLGLQIHVGGKILQNLLNIHYTYGALISYFVSLTFTLSGGLKTITSSSYVQQTILSISIVLIGASAIIFMHKHNISTLNLIPLESFYSKDTFIIALTFACMGIDPSFITRNLIATNANAIRTAVIIKSVFYLISIVLIASLGVIAHLAFPNYIPSQAFQRVIMSSLPSTLGGLAILGILVATISSAEASIHVALYSIRKDVLDTMPRFKNKLKFGPKIITFLLSTISIILALRFDFAVDLALFVGGFWFPIFVVPFVAALYNIHIPKTALFTIASITFCLFIAISAFHLLKGMYGLLISTAFHFTAFTIVRIIFKKRLQSA
ncbi:sodium:solute symporter family protein [Candidatus Sneabacter namystus]|uniref:Sodium:solute symporter family protein n=1 Tax=Candidatus Sneabacter namystus TaxID=2601646 RepID=A0A5C0UKT4_9RICK|nr:hypothetical protein [Candidatus Sneabacter namystus]QEK39464.1 hypothetical protein FZC37_00725 [Candidatus Sneabacter namystus]